MTAKTNKNIDIINSTKSYDLISNDVEYTNTILSKLYSDYRKQNLDSCDIQIIINGTKCIFTHKIILETHSKFFRKMIGTEKIISFNDSEINLKTMKLLLRYLYKGVFKTNSEKYFIRVKRLAKKLEFTNLYNALSNFQKNSNGTFEINNIMVKEKLNQTNKSVKYNTKEENINNQSRNKTRSIKRLTIDNKNISSKKKVNRKMHDLQNQESKYSVKNKRSTKNFNSMLLKSSIGEKKKDFFKISSPMNSFSKKNMNIFDNYESHPLMYSGRQNNYKISYCSNDEDSDF
uniref:BTB domain-containing protein n=1 Tax=Strongyloides stercoralis TaxID=6248 RepID=A0A0K0DWG7_STRER